MRHMLNIKLQIIWKNSWKMIHYVYSKYRNPGVLCWWEPTYISRQILTEKKDTAQWKISQFIRETLQLYMHMWLIKEPQHMWKKSAELKESNSIILETINPSVNKCKNSRKSLSTPMSDKHCQPHWSNWSV